jgi:hypothetical protein
MKWFNLEGLKWIKSFILPVTGATIGGAPFLGRRSPVVGASAVGPVYCV